MKIFVFTAIFITSIFSISNLANAKIKMIDVNSKDLLVLHSKQTESNPVTTIPSNDLKGMRGEILEHYRKLNQSLLPAKKYKEGNTSFIEVKEMKLLLFSKANSIANIEVTQTSQDYQYARKDYDVESRSYYDKNTDETDPHLWKRSGAVAINSKTIFYMNKKNGKWIIEKAENAK